MREPRRGLCVSRGDREHGHPELLRVAFEIGDEPSIETREPIEDDELGRVDFRCCACGRGELADRRPVHVDEVDREAPERVGGRSDRLPVRRRERAFHEHGAGPDPGDSGEQAEHRTFGVAPGAQPEHVLARARGLERDPRRENGLADPGFSGEEGEPPPGAHRVVERGDASVDVPKRGDAFVLLYLGSCEQGEDELARRAHARGPADPARTVEARSCHAARGIARHRAGSRHGEARGCSVHDLLTTLRFPAGSIDVRSALRSGTLWLETSGPLEGQWFRVTLRVEPPVHLATSSRFGPDENEQDAPSSLHWSMAAPSHGNAPPEDVFERIIAHAEENVRDVAAAFELPWRGYGLELIEVRRLVRDAATRALAACDPAALGIARRFHRAARWFVYGAVVDDTTRRVAQLATSCPGVLVLASAFRRRDRTEVADALLRAIARGESLRAVVERGVEAWLELRERDDVEREWPCSHYGKGDYARAQRLLVRRAGAQVDPEHLLVRPALGFAPEDVPTRPDLNADWFRGTAGAARAIARGASDGARLAPFLARHFRPFLSAARRMPPTYDAEGPGSAEHRLAERLVAYCLRTGRRPCRHSNPVRIFAEVARWARESVDPQSPESRLGSLLGRVRKLGLGDVVSVRELDGHTDWDLIPDLFLPAWSDGNVSVRGVTVEHVSSAAALAREGETMRHCVATVLPDVMSGHLHVFAVRAGASRLTLALRPRLLDGYEIAELRGPDDRSPFPAETAAVSRWVEAVNARVRLNAGPRGVTDDVRG